jgi:hypothetical protein
VRTGPMLQTPGRGYWILPPEDATLETDQLSAWLISGFSELSTP